MKIIYIVLLAAQFFLGSAFALEVVGRVTVREAGENVASHPAEDAVVFLESVSAGPAFEQAKARLDLSPKMSSKDKQFFPSVLPVLVGSKIEFPNDDRIRHNAFSLSKVNSFDLGLYGKGVSKHTTFPKTGLVKVYCNIHEAMVGYILVLENPFFTKTNELGAFKIDGVPKGKYRLVVWHRNSTNTSAKEILLGDVKEIAISGSTSNVANFELAEDGRITKHKNKWGKDYKDKY